MDAVDANRLKIWQALSEFFLDTELDDKTFDYIARVIVDTGYSRAKTENILWGEVYPVLEANLRSIAGEWAGWSDDWLLEHLRVQDAVTPPRGRRGIIKDVSRCWEQVMARLPGHYA